MGFVHLHIHSEYSLLKSACRIESLVEEAKALRFKSLALTDQNILYGTIPFYKACIREGIKPIIGIELHIVKEKNFTRTININECLLLAKNEQGYQNLLKLSTEANLEKYRVPAVDKETLFKYAEGLFLILNYQTSDVSSSIIEGKDEVAVNLLHQYKNHFGNDSVFLEIQCHSKDDLILNQQILEFSKKNCTEIVATNHVHFLKKEEVVGYQIVNAIRRGERLEEANFESNHYYFKSEQEMIERFQSYSDAILNSEKIANDCNVNIELGQMILPEFPVPNNKGASEYLRELCTLGLEKKYKLVTQEIKDRLDYELSIIQKMNFCDYFLIVWDFMRFAHESNMITGPGRGSAAGSIVAYVLEITNVDPIKYELLFERFLNPERVTMPDIDIDFPDHRREEVIEYVKNKYGTQHVAQIITFGTLAAKAAIRDVGKVLQTDNKLIDRIARLIPSIPGTKLSNAVKEITELKNLIRESDEARRLIQLAELVEGLPRHSSTHAAGVVMSREPLTDLIPLQAGQLGILNTQFPMDVLEELGLLKMDFLGLRNLTLIEQILKYVQYYEKQVFDLENIPMDDVKTFELLSSGDTTGVFQLESDGMRRVLTMLKPSEFEDIVAVNALYRPGPMENIPHYIEAKHGKRIVSYPHPSLKTILSKTYGVIVYQEQIMQIASKMAGFTLGEADLLRRAVSKKKREVLETERDHFVRGALVKGYSKKEADDVYDMIVRFADYGFNRSHAVAYSMIAYQLAYLKANFPLAFYASLLSSAIYHQEKLQQYSSEAKQMGITIIPPSVNESLIGFSLHNGKIQFGLAPIRHLGEKACLEIINKRKERPYKDLFDFCARVDLRLVTRRGIEALISTGCFDQIDDNRAKLLASLGNAIEYGQSYKDDSENPLFSIEEEKPVYIEVPPFTVLERLQFEKEAIGFYISGHPVQSYSKVLESLKRVSINKIEKVNKPLVFVSGLVEKVKKIKTKKGDSMAFITLSDETGDIEATVFPKVYNEIYPLLKVGELLFLEVKLEFKEKIVSVFITKAKRLDEIKIQKNKVKVFLKIEEQYESNMYLEKLKTILQKYKGNDEVYLHYEKDKRTIRLSEKYYVNSTDGCIEQLQEFLGIKNVAIKRI